MNREIEVTMLSTDQLQCKDLLSTVYIYKTKKDLAIVDFCHRSFLFLNLIFVLHLKNHHVVIWNLSITHIVAHRMKDERRNISWCQKIMKQYKDCEMISIKSCARLLLSTRSVNLFRPGDNRELRSLN